MRSWQRLARALLVGALLTLLVGCAATPRERPVGAVPLAVTQAREQVQRSDQAITTLVNQTQPGCSAAVAREGAVVWAGAAGLADLAAGTPVTTETRFDIASVSKQFTATAILMLQREGLLSVADPIGNYVDDLPDWADVVTLDQLIHHTSRIPDFWVELDDVGIGFSDPADQQETLEAIARETELEPGTGYFYSNSNYVLLAEVVTRVSGLSLPDFLQQRIFAPLELDMVLSPALHAPDIALSYTDQFQLQPHAWTAVGHAGIITTPSELARWGDQYRTGDIVQDDFAVGAVDEGAGELYAAGIDIEVDGDLNHTGSWGGHVSDFTVSEDRTTTIAVICNGHAGDRFGLADALWEIWR